MDIHLERFVEEVGLLGYEPSPPCDGLEDADELAAEALRQVEGYFRTERTLFELPLHLEGRTEFARAVFDEVTRRVPFGVTATYDAIAARAGRPRAARAVGNLMAKCPFSILVPCHRIVHASPRRADQLRSRWDRQKQWLLEFESGARDSDGSLVPIPDIDDTP